ncbi:MAG: hypothetical protein R3C32_06255 [Chloroflexota bacterium]
MIFARDRPHGPTIGGAEVGWNAMTFQTTDPHGLEEALVAAAGERAEWVARRAAILGTLSCGGIPRRQERTAHPSCGLRSD